MFNIFIKDYRKNINKLINSSNLKSVEIFYFLLYKVLLLLIIHKLISIIPGIEKILKPRLKHHKLVPDCISLAF